MDSKKDQEGNTKQEETMETKQQKEARNTEEFNLSEKRNQIKDYLMKYNTAICAEVMFMLDEQDKEFIRLLKGIDSDLLMSFDTNYGDPITTFNRENFIQKYSFTISSVCLYGIIQGNPIRDKDF